MAYSETLAERIRKRLARRRNVEAKKMFGGIGFLLNGNMCVGVWKDSLIVRVGPEQYEDALQESFVSEFDITGRAMKGWVRSQVMDSFTVPEKPVPRINNLSFGLVYQDTMIKQKG